MSCDVKNMTGHSMHAPLSHSASLIDALAFSNSKPPPPPTHRDLTLELPFTLTHPKPKPIISQMVTLPSREDTPSTTSEPTKEDLGATAAEKPDVETATASALADPRPSLTSVYDAIDHNLITFDT